MNHMWAPFVAGLSMVGLRSMSNLAELCVEYFPKREFGHSLSIPETPETPERGKGM